MIYRHMQATGKRLRASRVAHGVVPIASTKSNITTKSFLPEGAEMGSCCCPLRWARHRRASRNSAALNGSQAGG